MKSSPRIVTLTLHPAIDRVVRIEEGGVPDSPRPMMRMAAAEAAPATPVAPSTIEIRARVTLTAALR